MRDPGLYWVRCQDAKHKHHMKDCACVSMQGWTIAYVAADQDIYEFGYDQPSYNPDHPLPDSEWGPRLQLPLEFRDA